MGIAYLPDGKRIDYGEYIRTHPRWQKVRQARFEADGGMCVFCHTDLTAPDAKFETHHVSYWRLGHEKLRDVITLCPACHKAFHENWQKVQFWKGREEGHWEMFDLTHTANLCRKYWQQDKFISKDPDGLNLCNKDVQKQVIDEYLSGVNSSAPVVIDPNDIGLFVRNKRYELFFEAEKRGLSVEQFLDEYYGPKERGKNPIRQEAGKKNGTFDHTPESFHRHYSENKNINILMKEVNK